LTVVVQQLSGRDPVVEKLAEPLIDQAEYPALHSGDDFKEEVRARVAEELRGMSETAADAPEAEAGAR
jgi:hypothetical protein